jgi:predicted TIM-barrel fold metal-dependent hydrolase
MGFAGNMMFAVDDLAQRELVNCVYNDFLVDVQRESGDRLFPQALLPIWDMDLTLREMTRLHEAGIRGFTITDKPHAIDLPDLDTEYFAPMWSLANEMGAVFNFHVGSGAGPRNDKAVMEQLRIGNLASLRNPEHCFDSYGPLRRIVVTACQFFMSNARIMLNLCLGDMFDRHPNVKIFSVESGIGWVPFILEAMEYHLDEVVMANPAEATMQQRRPTEYFHDHFYVSFWFEKIAPAKLIEEVGVNNVLIETDVPHPSGLFPGALDKLAAATADWDAHTRRRVFQDNAAELFRIAIP